MIHDIGANIRNLRIKRGLSMVELARAAEVSRSFISQVEKNQANPSLQTLEKIALALDTSLGEFFHTLDQANQQARPLEETEIIVRAGKRTLASLPDNPNTFEKLTPDGAGNQMEFFYIRLAPNEKRSPYYLFRHAGEEYFYVLKGPIFFHVGSQEFLVNEGDSGYFDSALTHFFVNPGPGEAAMICAIPPVTRNLDHFQQARRVIK